MIAPILYIRVITDDLVLLLIGHDDKRRIDYLPNKRDLLLSIQHLHLEYRALDSVNADRASVFYSPDCWRDTRYDTAIAEARRTECSLNTLADIFSLLGTDEPHEQSGQRRLQTISTGSFLGGKDAHWEMCEIQNGRQAIKRSRDAMLNLLKVVGGKGFGFCQRGVYGPLALPYGCPGLLNGGFDVCIHIDQAVFRAPVATAHQPCEGEQVSEETHAGQGLWGEGEAPCLTASTIWYVEADRFSDSIAARELAESGEPMQLLGMYANYYNHNRLAGLSGPAGGDVARLRGFVSRAVSTCAADDNEEGRERFIHRVREHVNQRLLKTLGYTPRGYGWEQVQKDTVSWEMMDQAPVCGGCGWRAGISSGERNQL